MATLYVVLLRFSSDLPSVEDLKSGYRPPQVTRILARDGTLLANIFTERRTVIPFVEIPDHAKLAFLAAEDATFYEHEGLDYVGMVRALIVNLRSGSKRQGGSTITQQVVKNVLLDSERTYRRKIRETILARRLEQQLTKDEIFGLYLNHIYLGHGRYGIEEAARYYFGKKARELDVAESVLLAGLVAAPERFSPRRSPERALQRRRYVLDQMLAKGFVTNELRREVMSTPLRLSPSAEEESELAAEVVAHAKKLLTQLVGEAAEKGGYEIWTTIDPALQAEARQAVRAGLDAYAKRQKLAPTYTLTKRKLWGPPFEGEPKPNRIYVGVVEATDDTHGTISVRVGRRVGRVFLAQESRYNPGGLSPSEFAKEGALLRVSLAGSAAEGETPPLRLELGPQAALAVVDVRTRHVVGLVGSYEALAGGLDRARQARRQPGSAFKPFVYSYALHSRRITPGTVIELPARKGKDDEATRRIGVREAVAKSDNDAAVHVLREAGAASVVQWARALGVESRLEADESLALGAYEVTPLEIVNAYATFASGGLYEAPVLVTKIIGPDRQPLELPASPPARRVMSPEEAYLTTSLLTSVIQSGTGRRARALGRPLAGKTGTTNEAKDAWFVGYSTDLVAGVWVGYDDARPLGWGESGSVTALPVWVDFMKVAHRDRPVTQFSRPPGIVVARIDPHSGLLAHIGQQDAVEEEFLDGTAPTEVAGPAADEPSLHGEDTEVVEPRDAEGPGRELQPRGQPELPVAPARAASPPLLDDPPPF